MSGCTGRTLKQNQLSPPIDSKNIAQEMNDERNKLLTFIVVKWIGNQRVFTWIVDEMDKNSPHPSQEQQKHWAEWLGRGRKKENIGNDLLSRLEPPTGTGGIWSRLVVPTGTKVPRSYIPFLPPPPEPFSSVFLLFLARVGGVLAHFLHDLWRLFDSLSIQQL